MTKLVELDSIDRALLGLLQLDATLSIQALAERVGLSNNPCWRRIKRLEEGGVIMARVAVVNPASLGLNTIVFVGIRIDSHSDEWLQQFAETVGQISEIVECHRMTGETDYLLKVLVRDLPHYDMVYQKLIKLVPGLIDVSSHFSMEQLKNASALPMTN